MLPKDPFILAKAIICVFNILFIANQCLFPDIYSCLFATIIVKLAEKKIDTF